MLGGVREFRSSCCIVCCCACNVRHVRWRRAYSCMCDVVAGWTASAHGSGDNCDGKCIGHYDRQQPTGFILGLCDCASERAYDSKRPKVHTHHCTYKQRAHRTSLCRRKHLAACSARCVWLCVCILLHGHPCGTYLDR